MASSEIKDLVDAVTAELALGSFTPAITPVAAYQVTHDLPDMKTLRVSVVPGGWAESRLDRVSDQRDLIVHIGVQKKIQADSECDALMDLVKEIADYLNRRELTTMPTAFWIATENDPIYSAEDLEQLRQFTSVLRLTYRLLG